MRGRRGRGTSGRPALVVAATLLLAGAAPRADAGFRPGPAVLPGQVVAPGEALADLPWAVAAGRAWPADVLSRVRSAVGSETGGILVVGRTDPMGPRSLNQALGLRYACEAARALAEEVGAEPGRFACASRGEAPGGQAGVTVHRWSPPAEAPGEPRRITLLAPRAGLAPRGELWGLWDGEARQVRLWTGPDSPAWALSARRGQARVPGPAGESGVALGADLGPGRWQMAQAAWDAAQADGALALRVEAVEPWVATVRADVPEGVRDGRVWMGGIPYPARIAASGELEARVALWPTQRPARLEVVGSDGQVRTGPERLLPAGWGTPPRALAVLVWEDPEVDLDLHGWAGPRHVSAQHPGEWTSQVRGRAVELLFDGEGPARASALAAWGLEALSVEVRCYSDLAGRGTRAWLYLAEHPGDPLDARYRVLGPRLLSERPTRARWPAAELGGAEAAAGSRIVAPRGGPRPGDGKEQP